MRQAGMIVCVQDQASSVLTAIDHQMPSTNIDPDSIVRLSMVFGERAKRVTFTGAEDARRKCVYLECLSISLRSVHTLGLVSEYV